MDSCGQTLTLSGKNADRFVRSFAKSNIRLMVDSLYVFAVLSVVSILRALPVYSVSELFILMERSAKERLIS